MDEIIFTQRSHNVHINVYVQNSFHLNHLPCYWYHQHRFLKKKKKIGNRVAVGHSCTPATSQTDLKAALSRSLGFFPKQGSPGRVDSSSAPPALAKSPALEEGARLWVSQPNCSQLLWCCLSAKITGMKTSDVEGLPFCWPLEPVAKRG